MTIEPVYALLAAGAVWTIGICLGILAGAHRSYWEGYEAGSAAGYYHAAATYEAALIEASKSRLLGDCGVKRNA